MSWKKTLLNTPVVGNITKQIAAVKVSYDAHNIAKHFIRYLKPEVATTSALKEEVFRIRHDVYCTELNFEPLRADAMETDDFDQQSLFALIKHKPSGYYASCVRIVTSDNSTQLLPIEKYCKQSIEHEEFDPSLFRREEICEISRLAVRSDFRRRQSDQFVGSATGAIEESTYSETELRCFPFIAIGLYMAGASLALKAGKKHAFVMMEPRLARSLRFIGIKFIQIGKPIKYHGLRAPYYINAEIFLENLAAGFKTLYKEIQKDIHTQL